MTTARAFARLLRDARTRPPEDVTAVLQDAAASLGARDLRLYLVDYEQQELRCAPPGLDAGAESSVPVTGTMAGRCFSTQEMLEAAVDGGLQLWLPVTDRAERLGVLSLVVDELDEAQRELAQELGLLAALLVVAASSYTDCFHLLRRHSPLALAAEMQWSLLPPLSFTSGGTTVAGLLEPAYEVGGDCFDYALNGSTLDVAVFDAMGHGLSSSVLSGLAVGAYRHARRCGVPLEAMLSTMDDAVAGLGGDSFVTALVGQLDVITGRLTWMTAGHAAPIVVRNGRALDEPAQTPALPLGLGMVAREELGPAALSLEPGDRVLLYTDGVVEARSPSGEEFGLSRLVDLVVRESASGLITSEVLRRLVHTCLDFQGGRLRDDATLLLLEWDGPDGS